MTFLAIIGGAVLAVFLLVPVAAAGRSDLALPSLLFYLAAYALTNVAAFAVTAALPEYRDLTAYRGLARARPGLGVGYRRGARRARPRRGW